MHLAMRAKSLFAKLVLLVAALACATNPAARRATVIARADADARRAVESEERLNVSRIPPGAVSVTPFSAPVGDSLLRPLGYALSVVERHRLDAIMRELELVEQGRVDPQTAPRVGRLVGARRVVIGEVTPGSANDFVVRARVVDVIAGTVTDVTTASAPFARLFEAQSELTFRVYEALGVQLSPAERARIEARATAQLAAVVAYGRGLEAEARGDAAAAAGFFTEAARLDAGFVAQRYQADARVGATATSGVGRVVDLGVNAVNLAGPARVAEAADIPLAASQILTLLLTVRITP
jgi:hypothetical protein